MSFRKRVVVIVKLNLPAGVASPTPPLGPALGQHGVRLAEFCSAFNAATESQRGNVIPVDVYVYDDRSFNFIATMPPIVEGPVGESGDRTETASAATPENDTKVSTDLPLRPAAAACAVGSWHAAEALAAWHMRKLGFEDASVTKAGADGGLDVTSREAVAQVKHYSKGPIGSPAIQQLRGAAMDAEWAIFYS